MGEETLPVPQCGSADHRTGLQGVCEGTQRQVPPMYSAIKQDGQPLYKLARAGRGSRACRAGGIEIFRAEQLAAFDGVSLQLETFLCSKGTYVRVLGRSIARGARHLRGAGDSACGARTIEPFAPRAHGIWR